MELLLFEKMRLYFIELILIKFILSIIHPEKEVKNYRIFSSKGEWGFSDNNWNNIILQTDVNGFAQNENQRSS